MNKYSYYRVSFEPFEDYKKAFDKKVRYAHAIARVPDVSKRKSLAADLFSAIHAHTKKDVRLIKYSKCSADMWHRVAVYVENGKDDSDNILVHTL